MPAFPGNARDDTAGSPAGAPVRVTGHAPQPCGGRSGPSSGAARPHSHDPGPGGPGAPAALFRLPGPASGPETGQHLPPPLDRRPHAGLQSCLGGHPAPRAAGGGPGPRSHASGLRPSCPAQRTRCPDLERGLRRGGGRPAARCRLPAAAGPSGTSRICGTQRGRGLQPSCLPAGHAPARRRATAGRRTQPPEKGLRPAET